jgi:hypothetical protein
MNIHRHTRLIYTLLETKQMNKSAYDHQLQNDGACKIASQDKWKTELDETEIHWKKVYQTIFKTTIDTKLRNFQYKYTMRIIPTNKKLMKYKIKSSSLCDSCGMHIENQRHLFWECINAQLFWVNISNYLNSLNFKIECNYQTISFGIIKTGDNNSLQAKH